MKAADVTRLVAAASAQVTAVESLPGGAATERPLAEAGAAVEAAHRAAAEVLLPRQIPRISADGFAAYEAFGARDSSVEALAEVHERSLITFPDLAQVCRSPLGVADAEAVADRGATPSSHLETRAAAAGRARKTARGRYLHLIAVAIAAVADHDLAPVAAALLEAEGLAARLQAARQRLEQGAALVARAEVAG